MSQLKISYCRKCSPIMILASGDETVGGHLVDPDAVIQKSHTDVAEVLVEEGKNHREFQDLDSWFAHLQIAHAAVLV